MISFAAFSLHKHTNTFAFPLVHCFYCNTHTHTRKHPNIRLKVVRNMYKIIFFIRLVSLPQFHWNFFKLDWLWKMKMFGIVIVIGTTIQSACVGRMCDEVTKLINLTWQLASFRLFPLENQMNREQNFWYFEGVFIERKISTWKKKIFMGKDEKAKKNNFKHGIRNISH